MSSGYYRSLRIPVTPGRFRHSTALSPTRPPYPVPTGFSLRLLVSFPSVPRLVAVGSGRNLSGLRCFLTTPGVLPTLGQLLTCFPRCSTPFSRSA